MSSKSCVVVNPVRTAPVSRTLDAFGRSRFSLPYPTFSSRFNYDKKPLIWNELVSGGGSSAVFNANTASIQFNVGSGGGDRVIRQSKKYMPYQAGRSQLIILTAVMGSATPNVKKSLGYYDDDNGLFFELNESGPAVVVRSSASGVPVDTTIAQSSWNIDPMDGSGPSKRTLDLTKAQVFVIDFQWLGVGKVRFGFGYNGEITYVHAIDHANIVTNVYMSLPTLPVRYEVRNTSATGSTTDDFYQICSVVLKEGHGSAETFPLIPSSISTPEDTPITVTSSEDPILSIRPSQTFKMNTNRGWILPKNVNIIATTTGTAIWRLRYNPTINDTLWTSVGGESMAEFNTDATTTTGGHVVAQGFVTSSSGGGNRVIVNPKDAVISSDMVAARSIDATNSDIYTLTVQGVDSDTPDVVAMLSWYESL